MTSQEELEWMAWMANVEIIHLPVVDEGKIFSLLNAWSALEETGEFGPHYRKPEKGTVPESVEGSENFDPFRPNYEAALAYYNAHNVGANYKFENFVGQVPYMSDAGYGYHINFLASEEDSPPRLFFADLWHKPGDPDSKNVDLCCIMEQVDEDPNEYVLVNHPVGMTCTDCKLVAEFDKNCDSDESDYCCS